MIGAVRHILFRLIRERSGAVAVETVFILPFLLFGGLAAIDASFLMLQNHKMESGLSNAGSYLARVQNPNALEDNAKRLAVSGQIGSGGAARLSGWNAGDITVSYKSVANNDGDYRGGASVRTVTLSSQKPFNGFGILKTVFGGSITISARHEQRLIGAL